MSYLAGGPDDQDDVDAILAVPANRERFLDAMARAQATEGVPDDAREIERRLERYRAAVADISDE